MVRLTLDDIQTVSRYRRADAVEALNRVASGDDIEFVVEDILSFPARNKTARQAVAYPLTKFVKAMMSKYPGETQFELGTYHTSVRDQPITS